MLWAVGEKKKKVIKLKTKSVKEDVLKSMNSCIFSFYHDFKVLRNHFVVGY